MSEFAAMGNFAAVAEPETMTLEQPEQQTETVTPEAMAQRYRELIQSGAVEQVDDDAWDQKMAEVRRKNAQIVRMTRSSR